METMLWTVFGGLICGLAALALKEPGLSKKLYVPFVVAVFATLMAMSFWDMGVQNAETRVINSIPPSLDLTMLQRTRASIASAYFSTPAFALVIALLYYLGGLFGFATFVEWHRRDAVKPPLLPRTGTHE